MRGGSTEKHTMIPADPCAKDISLLRGLQRKQLHKANRVSLISSTVRPVFGRGMFPDPLEAEANHLGAGSTPRFEYESWVQATPA